MSSRSCCFASRAAVQKLLFLFICAGGAMGSGSALASDYGCKVLLCLANPAGPTALSQCVPPITQLWRDLASFHPFPTCDEAKPAVAVQGTAYYDDCPDGTTALAAGSQAIQSGSDSVAVGIGNGDGLVPTGDGSPMPGKVCVGKLLNSVTVGGDSTGDSGGGGSPVDIGTYDRVVLLDPAWSPRVIDVYINGALYRRVRW